MIPIIAKILLWILTAWFVVRWFQLFSFRLEETPVELGDSGETKAVTSLH